MKFEMKRLCAPSNDRGYFEKLNGEGVKYKIYIKYIY